MVNYANGKIYKIETICDHDEGDVYIGSTTKEYLSQRMSKHKSSYNKWLSSNANKTSSFDLFQKYGVENCQIVLLENCPCESKDQLHARETYYVKALKSCNKNLPKRSAKEYRDDNNEIINAKKREYRQLNKVFMKQKDHEIYEKNKDKIKIRQKIYSERNKDQIAKYKKEYYENSKAKIKKQLLENTEINYLV